MKSLYSIGRDVLAGVSLVYTDAATVKRVQAALGLKADGILGPKTKAAVVKANGDLLSISSDAITDDLIKALKIDTSAPAPKEEMPRPKGGATGSTALVPAAGAGGSTWDMIKEKISAPVPGIDLPVWQVALGALGAVAAGVGVFVVVRRKR